MENSIKEVSKTKKEISVSVPFEEFDKFIQNTTDKLVKEVEIKGFRKGQAPRDLAIKNIRQEEILRQAASAAVNQIYPEIIKESKLEVIGPPEIEILKLAPDNPLEFKAFIFIMPEIGLPDYRKIIKDIKSSEIIITDEEVEQAFKQLEEMKDNIPQEQKDRIKFDDPEELKRVLKQEIRKEKEVMEKGRVRNDILKLISEKCEFEVPEILVSVEKHRMLEDIKRNVSQVLKVSFEDYLKQVKKNEKELEDSLTGEVTERIKRIMILGKIQKTENIEATKEELEKEIQGFLNHPVNAKIKDQIDQKALNAYLKERIEDEKTLQLLEGMIVNN
ncbi:MAG: trigger factor [Candidatus Parcubacteria bacterium]|nr:trigger factor [Candidatus Parcubacteria bacterium]